jgi:hypothetical protein
MQVVVHSGLSSGQRSMSSSSSQETISGKKMQRDAQTTNQLARYRLLLVFMNDDQTSEPIRLPLAQAPQTRHK